MKTRSTSTSILSGIVSAIVAISLVLPGAAWADREHRSRGWQGYGYHQDRHHYKKHDGSRHHYKHKKKRSSQYYYKDDDDDNDEKVLIGLLLGGLIGYAISNSRQTDDYYVPPARYPAPATRPYDWP